MGHGINAVTGFVPTTFPRRGDIACQAQPFQHHAVVHSVYQDDQGRTRLITIDGNSAATSTITRNDSAIGSWTHFFKVAQLG